MSAGIYKITSPSGKIYVGQSLNIERRLKDYNLYKCKKQPALYNSLKKYGADNHKMETLITFEKTELTPIILDKFEECYIEYFDCLAHRGLNLRTGGRNYTYSDEAKLNMRNAKLGKKVSESHRQNLIISRRLMAHAVDQFSVYGKYIQSFESIIDAERQTGINDKSIADVCKNKKYRHTAGGYIWKYKNNITNLQ